MILSVSMFMEMKYTIDCFSSRHMLSVMAERDIYGVGYYEKRKRFIFLQKIADNKRHIFKKLRKEKTC